MIIWYTVPEIWYMMDVIAIFILGYFLHFYPHNSPPKWKFQKKTLGDFIILHKYTANHDYLLYCSSDMACDGCNCFSFWTICCPFTILYCQYFHPLTTQKIKISEKWKKNTGDNMIIGAAEATHSFHLISTLIYLE